jgi:hypothetical protein
VKKRIVFYSALAGYVIGFFARTTFNNPILEFLTPYQGCLLGAGPYGNAVLMVAPQNCVLYGLVGLSVATLIGLVQVLKRANSKRAEFRMAPASNHHKAASHPIHLDVTDSIHNR